jgi:hypothetical protein
VNADPLVHFFNSLYALTFKRKRIVAFFSAITLAQFLMGMYMVVVAARKPGSYDGCRDYHGVNASSFS